MEIGYLPHSNDFKEPRDRRGFYWFIKEKNLKVEIADLKKKYDVIYVSCTGNNLSEILEYKKNNPKTKLILDMVDSFLEDKSFTMKYLRGVIKFILGKEKKIYFNYHRLIKNFVKKSYAVICSTEAEKNKLLEFNKNVKLSLDYMEVDFDRRIKDNFNKKDRLDIFWEGKIYNLHHLNFLNNLSEELKKKIKIHILTDLEVEKIPNLYYLKANKISKSFKFNFLIYPWTKEKVYEVSNFCDIGIIPLNRKEKMAIAKPENKLILMWILGLPVITSDTPAYRKAMINLSKKRLCNNIADWEKNLLDFLNKNNDEYKKDISEINMKLVKEYNKKIYLNNWISIFETLKIKLPAKKDSKDL